MQLIYDSVVAAAITAEFQERAAGARIEKVQQPNHFDIHLRMSTKSGRLSILVSANPTTPRMHFSDQKFVNPLQAPSFCMLLRKHLEGAFISDITMPYGLAERTIQLTVSRRGADDVRLIVEIMGRHSNIILLNSVQTILGSIKSVGSRINRVREVRAGLIYSPPPTQNQKHNPMAADTVFSERLVSAEESAKWLQSEFFGVSTTLASEIAARSELPATEKSLVQSLRNVFQVVEAKKFTPVLIIQDHSKYAYPLVLQTIEAAAQTRYRSMSDVLDLAYAETLERLEYRELRSRLQTSLEREADARRRELQKVAHQIAEAAGADNYREQGDLVLANQHQLHLGMTGAVVADLFADREGVERALVLDPLLDPHENAERLYKKARQLSASLSELQIREARTKSELVRIVEKIHQLELADSLTDLIAVKQSAQAWISDESVTKKDHRPGTAKTQPKFEGHKIKTFISPDGVEVMVGETASSNDYLTTRIAASNDIWLHVRASTSAHGVIRTGSRSGDMPHSTIKFAAELVAARSDSKHSQIIPVDYTLKKYVRKQRRSAQGSVSYQNEKTIYVSGIHEDRKSH